MAYKQEPGAKLGSAYQFSTLQNAGLINPKLESRFRRDPGRSGKKRKEGRFMSTQYTQAAGVAPEGGELEDKHQTTVIQDEHGKVTTTDKDIYKGKVTDEGKEGKEIGKYAGGYTRELYRKRKDKDMSAASGGDVYEITKKRGVTVRTADPEKTGTSQSRPTEYTFSKYGKTGKEKSKTVEVRSSKHGERLSKKASKFTGAQRFAKRTAQGEAKMRSEKGGVLMPSKDVGAAMEQKPGGMLETGEQKTTQSFEQRVAELQAGKGKKQYVGR